MLKFDTRLTIFPAGWGLKEWEILWMMGFQSLLQRGYHQVCEVGGDYYKHEVGLSQPCWGSHVEGGFPTLYGCIPAACSVRSSCDLVWVRIVVCVHPIVCPVVLKWWAVANLMVARSVGPGRQDGIHFWNHSGVQRCVCGLVCNMFVQCPS